MRRLHAQWDALRALYATTMSQGLDMLVSLQAASLLRAFGVNLTPPQSTALKSCILQLLRKPKNRTHAELPREPTKSALSGSAPRCLGDQLNAADARTAATASLPEHRTPHEKRHRRAEPAEATARENARETRPCSAPSARAASSRST